MSTELLNKLRGIFVDDDVIVTTELLKEVRDNYSLQVVVDEERKQQFSIKEDEIVRVSFDKELNVTKQLELKGIVDIVKLASEVRGLEVKLKRSDKVAYNIFTMLRSLINENIAISCVAGNYDELYSSSNVTVKYGGKTTVAEDDYISMSASFKDNNVTYKCDLFIHMDDHDKSHAVFTLRS